MRGHEEASGTKYIPKYLFEIWEKKDPVHKYEEFLKSIDLLNDELAISIHDEIKNYIEEELGHGFETEEFIVDTREELNDIYSQRKEYSFNNLKASRNDEPAIRYIDAVKEGLHQSLLAHDNLIIMGQDIAEYGGAFKITEGFVEEFGKERIRNTPLCESGILGTALGLSVEGFKSVVEMQFADFVSSGFTQIVNNLAKIHYRWGQNADVVIRMPAGAGVGAGPFHSQSNEAWFVHTPGLKVVYPSTARDAKGY